MGERRVIGMTNIVLFLNSFLSYLLVFVLIVALVVVACILGAKWCKKSDSKKSGGTGKPVLPDTVEVNQ